jgi:PAS domain S-box-containing protein
VFHYQASSSPECFSALEKIFSMKNPENRSSNRHHMPSRSNQMKKKTIDKMSLKVLYLEDSPQDVEIIRELLTDAGYDLSMDCTRKKKEFYSFLRSRTYDVILSDFNVLGFDAFGALKLSNEICPDIPFICVSGSIGEETTIELIKHGAIDYVLKDRLVRLPSAIKRALDEVKEKKSRRRLEAALKESEERMRAIVEGTPHLFFYIQDVNANTTYVSPTVEQITGYKTDIWKKRKDWFITDAEFNQIAKEKTQAHLREGFTKESVLLEVCHANGNRILLEAYEYPIMQEGKVVGLQGIAHDITDRKRAEEALAEEKRRLSYILEGTNVGTWEWNIQTGERIYNER